MVLLWEKLESMGLDGVRRTKVPGGWLIAFANKEHNRVWGLDMPYGGMTFLPDPEHQWDGNSLP